jgi:hypothetical protein
VTIPAGSEEWNLARIQRLVAEHELERGRLEYKGELGNGHRTLEAIAALANTFGGVVLVGVDEHKEGAGRLAGVEAGSRDRLARMCWDQLVPPYSPDIVPVKLDGVDRYVLAVIVNPDQARRPVMLSQGNKFLVRIEGHNVPADWYRLQALFAEQQSPAALPSLPPRGNFVSGSATTADLGLRGRLLLSGQRGQSHHIGQAARSAILAVLNDKATPLTSTDTAGLADLMFTWTSNDWSTWGWEVRGRAGPYQANARWEGRAGAGQRLSQARLNIGISPSAVQGDALVITVEIVLTNPQRAFAGDKFKAASDNAGDLDVSYLVDVAPTPFMHLGHLRQLILDILATMWGPLGSAASIQILGQPLNAPAQLDLSVFTIADTAPSQIPINQCIGFGTASLIPGNTPAAWTDLGPIRPDRQLLQPDRQQQRAHEWTTWFALDNGYDNIEQELAHHTRTRA